MNDFNHMFKKETLARTILRLSSIVLFGVDADATFFLYLVNDLNTMLTEETLARKILHLSSPVLFFFYKVARGDLRILSVCICFCSKGCP